MKLQAVKTYDKYALNFIEEGVSYEGQILRPTPYDDLSFCFWHPVRREWRVLPLFYFEPERLREFVPYIPPPTPMPTDGTPLRKN